jgi:endonuclease III
VNLQSIIEGFRSLYGQPPAQVATTAWTMVVWDRVVYLANDEKRLQTYRELERRIGLEPANILAASPEELLDVCGGPGRFAAQCADHLRDGAELVAGEYGGDLTSVLSLPLAKAKRALMRFHGVGEPGAEKILLFTRTHPFLALESNGLRVLRRLGFGERLKSYTATYRAVQSDAERTIPAIFDARIEAHLLLRRHGQDQCRRTRTEPDECPFGDRCDGRILDW